MIQLNQIITGKSEKDLFTVLALKADIILFFVAGNVVATVGYNAVVYARRLEQSH
ncbi:hypothetical protein [Endozoicomonas sp. ALB091]|uniref:hypothetical protein n=1 Tax=Endozoicomonas sp. ALB091 TaxID=3403073 RepID=UPI003BB6BD2C